MITPLEALPAVLAQIDANLPQSLDRLFDFLRIPSISTDPAYREQCLESARFVAAELSAMGFATSIRPTQGHPVVVGSANSPGGSRGAPRVLFYGHYDVQPVDPLDLWDAPPFVPRLITQPDGRKAIVARGACDDVASASSRRHPRVPATVTVCPVMFAARSCPPTLLAANSRNKKSVR